jgi:hypothetical protein
MRTSKERVDCNFLYDQRGSKLTFSKHITSRMHAFGVMFFVGLFLNTIWAQRRGSHGEVQTCRNLESFGAIDEGCSATTPFCVDAKGFGVTDGNTVDHCVYCIHLSQPNSKDQVGVDEGCDDVKRVCTSDRKLKKINQGGTMCAVCVNTVPSDQNPNKFDDGCPPFAPVCVDDGNTRPKSGRLGTACVAQCVDTSVAAKDQGVGLLLFCSLVVLVFLVFSHTV